MKNTIINFFRHDRTFKSAVKLYHEHGNKISLKKRLNVENENEFLKGVLFEELRAMAGIHPQIFSTMISNQVVPETKSMAVNEIKAPVDLKKARKPAVKKDAKPAAKKEAKPSIKKDSKPAKETKPKGGIGDSPKK